MDPQTEKQAWRKIKSNEKFLNAWHGIEVFWNLTTKNLSIHLFLSLVAIILGFYFHISNLEWIAIVFAISFVLVAEALNTAIEIDIDLTSPQYHPYARDTKDVAAAAVLLASVTSAIVSLLIFLPKILSMLQ